MLNSLPAVAQVILWPLIGALALLTFGRLLPNWLRRLVGAVAAFASVISLRSLLSAMDHGGMQSTPAIEFAWEPVGLFRDSPTFQPDNLALLSAMILCGVTALLVFCLRGTHPRRTRWHGQILLALSGSLVAISASDLLGLALGSALLDVALITMACSNPADSRATWRMVAPGVLSTLVLLFSALQMDTDIGTTSIFARTLSLETLVLVTIAGLLRMLIFPLHPRKLETPEEAATLLLPMGLGIVLLTRFSPLASAVPTVAWIVAGSGAILVGGLFVWHASQDRQSISTVPLASIAVYQAGLALLFARSPGIIPWPLVANSIAMASLILWWDTESHKETSQPGWPAWIRQPLAQIATRTRSRIAARSPQLADWSDAWLIRQGPQLLAGIAMLSLIGFPLTAGARPRWLVYATLLRQTQAIPLLIILVADTFLSAGLWLALSHIVQAQDVRRTRGTTWVALLVLTAFLLLWGIAPGRMVQSYGWEPLQTSGVSSWGLGLIFVLPWLIGAWLSRIGLQIQNYLDITHRLVDLKWLGRYARRAVHYVAVAVHWLGQVGEGDGWWGWALIILALGAIFLAVR